MPIFIKKGFAGQFIQDTVDSFGKISRFIFLDEDLTNLATITPRDCRIGDHQIYVFFDGSTFHSGPLSEIDVKVSKHIEKISKVSLSLEWAGAKGISSEIKQARSAAIFSLNEKLYSKQSIHFFEHSLFLHSLVDHISKCALPSSNDEDILRIQRAALLHGDLNNPNLMPDTIWDQLKSNISVDRRKLRQLIFDELPDNSISNFSNENYGHLQDYDQEAHLVASALRKIGRQEERLGVILDLFIREPELGDILLHIHRDRGKIVRNIQKILIAHVSMLEKSNDRELFVARLIKQIFTLSFTFTRGETLYFLALALGRHPHVASAIRHKMSVSNAYNVFQMRPHIEDAIRQSISTAQ